MWALQILTLPDFFFVVSCSGLLGKEGVVQQQLRVLLFSLPRDAAALLAITQAAEVRIFLAG